MVDLNIFTTTETMVKRFCDMDKGYTRSSSLTTEVNISEERRIVHPSDTILQLNLDTTDTYAVVRFWSGCAYEDQYDCHTNNELKPEAATSMETKPGRSNVQIPDSFSQGLDSTLFRSSDSISTSIQRCTGLSNNNLPTRDNSKTNPRSP